MNAAQNYDPTPGSANKYGQTAQNAPQTGQSSPPAAYGTWLVDPPLHQPAAPQQSPTASVLATYSALHIQGIGSRYAVICDALAEATLGPIHVAEPLTMSLTMLADFRKGISQPSSTMIGWLATVHPQVNLTYLFRAEGEPLLPAAPVLNAADRLTGDTLRRRLADLRQHLRTQIYPALTDPANTIYEPGEEGEEDEIVTLSERALAVNLHREFVHELGAYQADWIEEYWQELGYLFGLLFGYADQRTHLLSDRVFLSLLHAFAV